MNEEASRPSRGIGDSPLTHDSKDTVSGEGQTSLVGEKVAMASLLLKQQGVNKAAAKKETALSIDAVLICAVAPSLCHDHLESWF